MLWCRRWCTAPNLNGAYTDRLSNKIRSSDYVIGGVEYYLTPLEVLCTIDGTSSGGVNSYVYGQIHKNKRAIGVTRWGTALGAYVCVMCKTLKHGAQKWKNDLWKVCASVPYKGASTLNGTSDSAWQCSVPALHRWYVHIEHGKQTSPFNFFTCVHVREFCVYPSLVQFTCTSVTTIALADAAFLTRLCPHLPWKIIFKFWWCVRWNLQFHYVTVV